MPVYWDNARPEVDKRVLHEPDFKSRQPHQKCCGLRFAAEKLEGDVSMNLRLQGSNKEAETMAVRARGAPLPHRSGEVPAHEGLFALLRARMCVSSDP